MSDSPTMRDILNAFHEGEIRRSLDEIDKGVSALRSLLLDGQMADADVTEIDPKVSTIGFYANALPAQIENALRHARDRT